MSARQRRKVIVPRLARPQGGHGGVGHAILIIGRDLPVPVDHRLDIERVFQPDAEPLAGIEDQPLPAPGVFQPEDVRGPTADVQHTAGGAKQVLGCCGLRAQNDRQRERGHRGSTCRHEPATGVTSGHQISSCLPTDLSAITCPGHATGGRCFRSAFWEV